MVYAFPATANPFNDLPALKACLLWHLQENALVRGLRKIHPLF
jgi:hypothetical protein